jgi:hypothetical protein
LKALHGAPRLRQTSGHERFAADVQNVTSILRVATLARLVFTELLASQMALEMLCKQSLQK